eukprot:CAMPEP_0197185364 /NCGR_PEP_ID=MMETSP1423-20130617/11808_1 /TAXON_ID=476441 /ORGANISM="Pseudo-nitzschia heimii, Strain UNC1101" /LENGTH=249 /DNA_ID=CAMNT_0042636403 /DNA_START=169 /DNA_END=917 /DNA_ORIENTATION=+
MPKVNKRGDSKNGNQRKSLKHKMPSSMIKRGNKREVVFDPEARKAHLRGFSERKRERRAFGLAMQKVKERKARIEQRASEKKDELQRVVEAEQQKEQQMDDIIRMSNAASNSSDSDEGIDENIDSNEKTKVQLQQQPDDIVDTKIYDGKRAETSWGGQVTVTTFVVDLDDDSDDENSTTSNFRNSKSIDKAQKYAGNVQRFMDELKGNMPGKKNRDNGFKSRRKGKNGAAEMKGVGGSGNLKIASEVVT